MTIHDILLYFIKKYNKNQFFRSGSGEPRFPPNPPPSQGTYVTFRPPETPPSQGNQWLTIKGGGFRGNLGSPE